MKLKKYMYALVFSLVGLVVSIVYVPVKTAAYMERGYSAVGGEVLLWILPFVAVIALDTFINWRRVNK